MSRSLPEVSVYTDGSCSGNGQKRATPGGWAAVLVMGPHSKELSGGEADSTNNRMEIMGILEALRALKEPCSAHIFTDSAYVMDAVTKWMPGWKRNGWTKKDGQPVKNRELFEALDAEIARHQVRWTRVKGHSGHRYNERCDELAVAAAARFGGSGRRRV